MDDDRAAAIHENYLAALGRVTVLGPGAHTERRGPWLLLDAGLDFDFFNVAALTAETSDPVGAIVEAVGWFAARAKPFRFIFRDRQDRAAIEHARARGFLVGEAEPAMLLEEIGAVTVAPPPGLDLRPVSDAAMVAAYAGVEPVDGGDLQVRTAISRRAFELAGCQLFIGYVDGRPAARSLALVTGEMVGVYNVFVRQEYRGRGFGRAMTAAVVAAGRQSGATAASLSATDLGLPLYQKMGFREVYRYLSLWKP